MLKHFLYHILLHIDTKYFKIYIERQAKRIDQSLIADF